MKNIIAAIFTAILPLVACASPDIEYNNSNNHIDDMTINVTIDGKTMTATLVDNSSTRVLFEKLQQSDVTYTANDYGGFEKVGALGFSLPRNDRDVTTTPGDIILYQGSNLCLYYATNTWDFTPIGKINFSTEAELRDFLKAGKGQITVTLSLPFSGVVDVTASENNGATEYYNPVGVKVGSNAKGFVLSKSGNKIKKIIR